MGNLLLSWGSRFLVSALVITSVLFGPATAAVAATGDPFRFIYDQNGRLAAAVTPTDSAKWTYDAVGNITAITRQAATTLSVIEFAPHSGQVGATVTIYGTAFSTTPGSNIVKFNGTTATVISSTTTQIVTTVPAGATSGTISVKVGTPTATSAASFTVLGAIAPTISGFSPGIAVAGATLTITGTNFDTNPLFDKTVIGGTFNKVSAATATSITAVVPPLPNSGKVVVATPNGVATSSNDFFAVPTGFTASDIGPTGRLTFGSPSNFTWTVAGSVGLFVIDGAPGQRMSLALSGSISQGYYVWVRSPDGSILVPSSCCSTSWIDTVAFPMAGTYTVVVDAAGVGTGSLSLTPYDVPADATSPITAGGSPVTLSATVPGQNITYTFTGSVGERVSLSLSPTGMPDGYWFSIKNPDGTYLYGISCCGIRWADTMTLTQSGTYTILVDLVQADLGSATATLYDVPADATTGLVVGGPSQTLTVTTPGQNAVFTFSGTTGDHLTFTLGASYTYGWYLTVRNPDGSPLWGTSCCLNTTATFTLTQTGPHSVLVDPVDAATGDATGSIALAAGLAAPIVAASEASAPDLRGNPGGMGRPLAAAAVSLEPAAQHTKLVGQVLEVEGRPLAGVVVKVGELETRTDSLGRFELVDPPSGHQTLCVDGRAIRFGDFGMYEIGVDVREAGTTEIGFPIWLSRIDDAPRMTIDSPTTNEVVLTTPKIPGLEIHLAPGTVITNDDGEVIHELSISELSRVRPPFPLPSLVETPVYFTVQPGGAYLSKKARVYYPNLVHAPAGTRVQFWHYSPDGRGWYVYGWGEVTADGKQVVPDPGVGVYELTGSMIHFPFLDLPALWAAVGDFLSDGDPVDLGTGLFNMEKTDLAVADVMPVALGRTYRSQDTTSRFFGIGSTSSLEIFLKLVTAWQELVLVLPDGGQVRYLRINPGNLQADAIFEHTATPTRFYKSRVTWNGTSWDLKLADGTKYVFNNDTTLAAVVDRFSNRVTFDRVIGISDHINVARSPNGRWLKFSYDGSDRISMVEDNIGRTVLYTYDASGRLWKVTDPNGKVTEYGYDGAHRLTTIKDPRLITWVTNVYDATSGRVSQQTQVDGGVYQFAYTVVNGKVTQTDVTDPRNFVRRVTFNASGYGVTDTLALGQPEQQTTSYERDPSSNLVLSTTDALGRVTRNTYDTSGNPLTITSLDGTPDAVTTTFTYDALFNDLASVKDPLNHITVFGYDAKGNRRSETDPLTHQTLFDYYASGQLFTSTNALAKTTTFTYQNGDVASISDPLGRVTKRFADAAGRPTFVTDPLGNTARTDYDLLNRVTQVTDPRSGVTVFTYDENGNRLTVKDAKLNVTTYTYDNMDQVATRKDALLKTETYTYDKQGNVLTTTDRKGQVTEFRYDSLGRQSFAGFGRTGTAPNFTYQSTVSYTRDVANRLHIAADSVGGTITREYDLLDRLTSETTGQGAITYQYDNANRRSQLQVAGQTAVVYGYDDADRLMSVTQGTTVVGFGYDNADRRTSLSLPGNLSLDYGYDDASQLLSITYKHSGSTIGDLAYSYDLAGRRATTSGSYARLNLPAAVTSATYNVNNQLTKWGSTNITYDLNGNMNGDGTNTYSWNARNQLSAVTKSGQTLPSFTYDAFGRRQKKTLGATVTSYLYDGGNTVQELTGGSPTANVLTGPGLDEIFQRSEGATTRTFLADALGSVVALADTAGVVQTSYTYAPYGETTVSGAASNNKNQYTGRENDSDGLYFYRARYFQPVFGRFVSEDPLGFGGGDSDLYAYTGGRPTYLTDPSGLILPLLGTCAAGAAFSIATDFVRFLQAGARKEDAPSHGELLGSAAGGCVAGLAGLGAARLVSFVRFGRLASKLGVTRGELQEIASAWDKSTFKSAIDSAVHHYAKHGEGQGILQYTRDAVDFLARNGLRAFTKALETGEVGIKINTPDYFGIYTFLGKIVSYGPR